MAVTFNMPRAIALAVALWIFPAAASANEGERWSAAQLETLLHWVDSAAEDALPVLPTDALDAARTASDPQAVDAEADALALRLMRMHLLGSATEAQRRGWDIPDSDREIALEPMLQWATASDILDTFLPAMRPRHPEYAALKAAYARETDQTKRKTIAVNMERWRWMPQSLGEDYVFVNAALYEAEIWRDAMPDSRWRVIVGKRSTPTPVFRAEIQGVILNPWWEIPTSIVRESVGALVRNNPAAAKARGYVVQDGRYRQEPGPNNALGLMKLVMPNPYSVFMHDTPNRQLFEKDVRSFSHGCIRTGDAIGFAATLLEGVKSREEVDAIVASGQTTTVSIARPMPVYITYFTAVSDGLGGVRLLNDIYSRDGKVGRALSLNGAAMNAHKTSRNVLSFLKASAEIEC